MDQQVPNLNDAETAGPVFTQYGTEALHHAQDAVPYHLRVQKWLANIGNILKLPLKYLQLLAVEITVLLHDQLLMVASSKAYNWFLEQIPQLAYLIVDSGPKTLNAPRFMFCSDDAHWNEWAMTELSIQALALYYAKKTAELVRKRNFNTDYVDATSSSTDLAGHVQKLYLVTHSLIPLIFVLIALCLGTVTLILRRLSGRGHQCAKNSHGQGVAVWTPRALLIIGLGMFGQWSVLALSNIDQSIESVESAI